MKTITRRSFLQSSLATAATVSFTARSWSQVAGANSQIRAGVVGFRGRGGDHIGGLLKLASQNVKIAALCDVDSRVLQGGIKRLSDHGPVQSYTDMRRLFDNKDIDVISIATPNHWHALAAIWAIQAGKDVYLEKPVSHNVWEGRQIVVAARKYNRIVQTGTQSRSSNAIKEAVEWVRAGNLGKILVARGLCYKPRQSIGKTDGPHKVPDNIDYDLWCGPAPLDPPRRNNPQFGPIHYDWHWFWAYGCGDLGNQGIHEMDRARWFLGEMELSPRVFSVGGRLGYEDDAETPNTQIVYHDYAKAPLIFEVRGLPKSKEAQKEWGKNMDTFLGGRVAAVIQCEGGYALNPSYDSVIVYDKDGKELKRWSDRADRHYENFIHACRTRKHTDLNADILEGHLSSALCHTGNVSYRLGSKRSPGEIRERLQGNSAALETFGRMEAHLRANGVDLDKDKLTFGEFLAMDPKAERFTNSREADALLTRLYRRPYVVPEKV
ncbi:MAG: Gfo/Idh/MocA family oxidoreductase [Verrucomicrobia bacterium]|nr:Gfo/Idh/MocA family oxidoreductase [Verrucomicrobiota bacterium]